MRNEDVQSLAQNDTSGADFQSLDTRSEARLLAETLTSLVSTKAIGRAIDSGCEGSRTRSGDQRERINVHTDVCHLHVVLDLADRVLWNQDHIARLESQVLL